MATNTSWTPNPDFCIHTPRLLISHFIPDSQAHCQLLIDLAPNSSNPPPNAKALTLEDGKAVINGKIAQHQSRHGYGHFLVSLKVIDADPKPIGIVSLVTSRGTNPEAWFPAPDVGFGFLPEAQGKGYATEAAGALMEYAKEHWGINEVFGMTRPDNIKSVRTLERLGLEYKGTGKVKMLGGDECVVYALRGMKELSYYVGERQIEY